MLPSQTGLDHEHPWRGHGCSPVKADYTMDVIMPWPWIPSCQNGLDHGSHRGWAMDALFSDRVRPGMSSCFGNGCSLAEPIGLWTSSWLGHGCSFLFSESVRLWRRGDVRFRPNFDERTRGMAAHLTLRKGQRTGAEIVGCPLEFGPLQPENLGKHRQSESPWSAAGRWAWELNRKPPNQSIYTIIFRMLFVKDFCYHQNPFENKLLAYTCPYVQPGILSLTHE